MNLYGNMSDQPAVAGMLYGMNPKSVISYPAGATVDYGKGCFLDSGAVTNAQSSSEPFVGVALFHQNAFAESVGDYPEKDTVNVIEKGYVWVVLDDSVTPSDGDTAYVTASGVFTTVSTSNIECGKFKSSATSDGLALVNLL